jgi:glucosamine--fructose-6-phosphate aminotransferase (isomerizing)
MIDDIRAQPAVLRQAIPDLQRQLEAFTPWAGRLRSGEIDQVVLTGMGGSFATVFPLQLALIAHGVRAWAVESSELLYDYAPLLTRRTLVVAISQSGRSAEIVRLVDAPDRAAAILGVTNTPGSPLAERANAALFIRAGEESAVSTKTYTCTLAGLHLLSAALAGGSVSEAADQALMAVEALAARMPGWEQGVREIVGRIEPARFMVFLGRGQARASALAAALAVKETAKVPTEGMLGGQFRHGPLEVMSPGVVIVIFLGRGPARALNLALAADLVARGGQVVCVGKAEDALSGALHIPLGLPDAVDERLSPLCEIVPMQWLAAHLAMARGIVPGAFVHSTKVTTVE